MVHRVKSYIFSVKQNLANELDTIAKDIMLEENACSIKTKIYTDILYHVSTNTIKDLYKRPPNHKLQG